MVPSALQLSIACLLVALGSWFAVHERRSAQALNTLKSATSLRRLQQAARIRRRVKIATLLVSSGILFGCSAWTEPRRNPVLFLSIWGFAFLLATALLWYGFVDFYTLRREWLAGRRTPAQQAAQSVEVRAEPAAPGSVETPQGHDSGSDSSGRVG